MAVSGRYCSHYLWFLTQSNLAEPKNLGGQAIFVWYLNERGDLKLIYDENNVLSDDELNIIRIFLKSSKHACLYIRNWHFREFKDTIQ